MLLSEQAGTPPQVVSVKKGRKKPKKYSFPCMCKYFRGLGNGKERFDDKGRERLIRLKRQSRNIKPEAISDI